MTKNLNIPVRSKQEDSRGGAEERIHNSEKSLFWRLTNAQNEKDSSGTNNIKNQVKKGIDNFVRKGQNTLEGKYTKIVAKKAVAKVKDSPGLRPLTSLTLLVISLVSLSLTSFFFTENILNHVKELPRVKCIQ